MKFTALVIIALIIGVTFVGCGESKEEKEIVFMDNFKVFEEFEMKKDYDTRIEQELGVEQKKLDSLSTILETIKDPLLLDKQKKVLFEAQQQFDQQFSTVSAQYTDEVYKRLNEYIQTYGKLNNYHMIMGSNGQGSVMYVDSTANITKDLIQYINKEYAK